MKPVVSFGGYDLRTPEEKDLDRKYEAHMDGDCDPETCWLCIEARETAEESLGG